MSLRRRASPARISGDRNTAALPCYPENIIPRHDRTPEILAAASALSNVENLRKPSSHTLKDGYDLLDWLGVFFGFQKDNVRNQRENLILHLANLQMRRNPPPVRADVLDDDLLRGFRKKLLKNYSLWCSYVYQKSEVRTTSSHRRTTSPRRTAEELRRWDLLYVSLYLLIWGEAANLRFCPECLCFIFHNMARELNLILDNSVDPITFELYEPRISGQNAFLNDVVKPIYDTIGAEVEKSKNGTRPHSSWRNYDDINEYFWKRNCITSLNWPLNRSCNFFVDPSKEKASRVGKTGFVEQRSFWNVFRSFERLWLLLILFFQAAVIVAWDNPHGPFWKALEKRDTQVKLLTVFITWSTLRLVQSILDAGTQYSLVTRQNVWLAVRMALKCVVAATWIAVFSVFYAKIWDQKHKRGRWSIAAETQIFVFLKAVAVFLAPELFSLLFFLFPWKDLLEKINLPALHLVTWWFHTRVFVGRGISEGPIANIRYACFWGLVLASKFSFSYFLQIKPLMKPTESLLTLDGPCNWPHDIFGCMHRLSILSVWSPVVIIYFMDVQLWYSIYSSLFGAVIGLLSHLGEIRNTAQLKLRFQFFAGAMQFNLMPGETVQGASILKRLKDAIRRKQLRYGFGRPLKKIESDQVDATRFSFVWNEVIITMREEDIISDGELEFLVLPHNAWNIRVVRWPCILLCNELLLAISQAKEMASAGAGDKKIWRKMRKREYRRCAVIEACDGIKFVLLSIVKVRAEEHSIISKFFDKMGGFISNDKFTVKYNLTVLPKLREKLVAIIEALLKRENNVNEMINLMQGLYEISIREFRKSKSTYQQLINEGLAPASNARFLFEDGIRFPRDNDEFFYKQLRRLHVILTSRGEMHNVPVNLEARRRLAFFSNSVFMDMPRAPIIRKMMAFTVLTPYFDEDVIYTGKALLNSNDGVSNLLYLQKIYEDEWENYLERMRREGLEDEKEIIAKRPRDLRLWASYRGQTLSRTVRGMMYYYSALKMFAFLDSASEVEIKRGHPGLASYESMFSNKNLNGNESGRVRMKFSYVVACQMYGDHKKEGDTRAQEILYLMKNNEALRVAYVHKVHVERDEIEYHSVLVKYDRQLRKEVEIYRIKLPGPVKLGEGKPENQNHALIFTRGDAVQTIDMNQDNYFEEALKMRNLLEEFKRFYGIRKPTILGVRENIFTGSVSSLAWFMSAQEKSFVTLGQRVLANTLKVRMHYGHPDVFDRFWFITRGGVSKASKVINISEDIFAGFNCTLRGGNVTHHEYIQVGKGRDVGLNEISMFEAKIASGSGEQVLSRDIYRLGHRLDFFRMLSLYHSTVGFYFNSMLMELSIFAFLWGRLYLALSGMEEDAKNGAYNIAMGAVLNQQFIIQLGLFAALPTILENYLEHGFLPAIWDFLKMQLQLAPIFYTFSLGTRTHYFGRTILHGGAKYRATGRGFVFQHKRFSEIYRLYSRSHFVKAFELGVILILYTAHSPLAKDGFVYVTLTFSSWFLVISWMMTPFLFNPSSFDWLKTADDFEEFLKWIWSNGGISKKAHQSWETWWYEEQDHLRTTGFWGKVLEVILDLRFFVFQYNAVYRLKIVAGNERVAVYFISWIYLLAVAGIFVIIAYARDKYDSKLHICFRMIQLGLIVAVVLVIVLLLEFTHFELIDIPASLLAIIPTGWGCIQIALVVRPVLQNNAVWTTVVSFARLYDMLIGIVVMAPIALMSWLPGFQFMQTRILFNDALNRKLQLKELVTAK